MEALTFNGIIQEGRFVFADPSYEIKVKQFKQQHEREKVELTFEVVDTPEHFQFKYLWGFLYPDVAEAMGERDFQYVHFECKKRFLMRPVEDWKEIPSKHRSRAIILTKEVEGVEKIVGYVPSLSVLKFKELKTYIEQVEHFLFADLMGHIMERRGLEEARNLAHGIENNFETQMEFPDAR